GEARLVFLLDPLEIGQVHVSRVLTYHGLVHHDYADAGATALHQLQRPVQNMSGLFRAIDGDHQITIRNHQASSLLQLLLGPFPMIGVSSRSHNARCRAVETISRETNAKQTGPAVS